MAWKFRASIHVLLPPHPQYIFIDTEKKFFMQLSPGTLVIGSKDFGKLESHLRH